MTVAIIESLPDAAWFGTAMVSLPIIPDVADPKTVVGFKGDTWFMFDTSANDYIQYAASANESWFNPADQTPGRGFWALFPETVVSAPYGIVPDQTSPKTIHLSAGWNLIGQPFVESVKWDLDAITIKQGQVTKTLKEAFSIGWVQYFAWGWNTDTSSASGGEYYLICDQSVISSAISDMAPWKAYWFRSYVDCDMIIPAP